MVEKGKKKHFEVEIDADSTAYLLEVLLKLGAKWKEIEDASEERIRSVVEDHLTGQDVTIGEIIQELQDYTQGDQAQVANRLRGLLLKRKFDDWLISSEEVDYQNAMFIPDLLRILFKTNDFKNFFIELKLNNDKEFGSLPNFFGEGTYKLLKELLSKIEDRKKRGTQLE